MHVQPKPAWIKRKEDYIASIAHKSASAVLVATADKVHNARAILRDFRRLGAELWPRFNKDAGETGTLGYYRSLVTALRERAKSLSDPRLIPLIEELDGLVTTLEREVGRAGVWPIAR